MRVRKALLPAAAFLLSLVVAGCTDASPHYVGGAKGVPLSAPAETGNGAFAVKVRVVKETGSGEAIVGAPIVIYPIEKPASAPSFGDLVKKDATMGGRTGADGTLIAWLDKGATYTFITAVENWTAEARHLVKITDQFAEQPLLITVFALQKTVDVAGSVPTTPKLDLPIFHFSKAQWFASDVKFHEDPATNRQYVHRILTANSKLRWTVNPGEYAEFGLRVGFIAEGGTEGRYIWEVDRLQVGPPLGSFEETLKVEAPQLAWGDKVQNPRFAIGPITHEGVLAPSPIPWTVSVVATFGTGPVALGYEPFTPNYVPSPAPVLVLLVMLGAALGLRTKP